MNKVLKFKKYISWNIISVIGYFGLVVSVIFFAMFSLASSNINMRADLNDIFFDYIFKHILIPYFEIYKFQLFLIVLLLIGSGLEHHKYNESNSEGFVIFENSDKFYSIVFFTGLMLNFVPLYIFFLHILSIIIKICVIML